MSETKVIECLINKTFKDITRTNETNEDCEALIFQEKNGDKWIMTHNQDCCEDVYVDDICGDLNDLIGEPLIQAEEVTNSSTDERDETSISSRDCSYTWTFYKFATKKGCVTIRWYGTSNGYYSETVDIYKSQEEKQIEQDTTK